MKSIPLMYVKLLLTTGVIFGLIMGLFFGLTLRSAALGAALGLASGSAFGLVMSVTLGTVNVLAHRSTGGRGGLSPVQRAVVSLPGELKEEAARVRQAMAALGGRDLVEQLDGQGMRIAVRTRRTWRSWGESVTADLHPDAKGSTLSLVSRPILRSTVVDYGQGRRNVRRVLSAVGITEDGRG